MKPLVEELDPCPEIVGTLRSLANLPNVLLLESSLQRDGLGRYSFLCADPCEFLVIPRGSYGESVFGKLRKVMAEWSVETVPELPPFQGGVAGLLSYELGHVWEQLPRARHDEFQMPDLAVGIYDWVIAWDHLSDRAWIVSQGFPETDPEARHRRAAARLENVKERLKRASAVDLRGRGVAPLPADRLAPRWPAPGLPGLTSNFSHAQYLQAVERVIEYIYAGDIFQANLSQRLLSPQRRHPLELYEVLRKCNPAPFAGYFASDDWAIVSASPERFACVRSGEVETRPIKGTRRRASHPEADLFSRDELRESAKDQAENVMIVDLLRNDLSRVCAAGTVRVPALCRVETYETVQHLVSEIRARLDPGRDAWDLFSALFPGGSITGAPKVRAMEIIAELEPTVRGPYCGSLFYSGFDGTTDSSILIRTFVCRRGWVQCCVGGGIVAQSDPQAEYEETLHKAEGMLAALRD